MKLKEKIVILGASDNPNRIGCIATKFLYNKGYDVFAVSHRKGEIDGIQLHDSSEKVENADTVTIFLNPERQKSFYEYILSAKPKRIIFNPGAENHELEALARSQHIQIISGCTIALFSAGFGL